MLWSAGVVWRVNDEVGAEQEDERKPVDYFNVFIAAFESRVQCWKQPSSWKLPARVTSRVFRETTDSVFCIGLTLHKRRVWLNTEIKRHFKKNVEKGHKLIKKQTIKTTKQNHNRSQVKRILVKLPCSFQEPWNVIVRLFEQLNRSIWGPTVATLNA